jgi:hypothetical protein
LSENQSNPVSEDLPSDVVAVITQLSTATLTALAEGDADTARATVDTMARVATNKLPAGDQRRTVRHACDRIAALLTEDPNFDAATAYVAALDRRFPTES